MKSEIDNVFNTLLGQTDLEVRKLLDKYPHQAKTIHDGLRTFTRDVERLGFENPGDFGCVANNRTDDIFAAFIASPTPQMSLEDVDHQGFTETINKEEHLRVHCDGSLALHGGSPDLSNLHHTHIEGLHEREIFLGPDYVLQSSLESSIGEGNVNPALLSLDSVSQADDTTQLHDVIQDPNTPHEIHHGAAMVLKPKRKRCRDVDIGGGRPKEKQKRPSAQRSSMLHKIAYLYEDKVQKITHLISPTTRPSSNVGQMVGSLTKRMGPNVEGRMPFLIDLLFAVASPNSICQLRDALGALRNCDDLRTLESSNSIEKTVQRLDQLKLATTIHALLRRLYILRLHTERDVLKTHLGEQRLTVPRKCSSGRAVRGDLQPGKVSSAVLKELMKRAYPSLQQPESWKSNLNSPYDRNYKSLKNYLYAATNWELMRAKFGLGVIALVPTGGDFHIQNQSFEFIPRDDFSKFIKILSDLRGDFICKASKLISSCIEPILEDQECHPRFKFEFSDWESLSKMGYDSRELLELCHPA